MGQKYQAQKRVSHVAIASEPDMIKPTPNSPPAPFITYAEFDTATHVADQGAGNQYPLFTSKSVVPHCKGGPPKGMGVKSGTWNGEFRPTEWTSKVKVDGGWQIEHGDKGTINNNNAQAKVTIFQAPGAPSSPCIAALQVQFERLKAKAAAEFDADKWGFAKGMGQGAWDNVRGYGESASSLWDSVQGGAAQLWNDPWGSLTKAANSVNSAIQSAKSAVANVVDLGKSIYNGDPSLDDMLDGMEQLVNELGEEAACALAEALKGINDSPQGVANSVGALGSEIALQVSMAMLSGGAGNAAAAAARGSKMAKLGGKGFSLGEGIGEKLRGLGLKGNESLSEMFRKLKEKRLNNKKNAPDTNQASSAKNTGASSGDANHKQDTQNQAKASGNAKDACPLCPTAGKPVNPVQGCKILAGEEDLDFSLPGIVPLQWQRTYSSRNPQAGWWGQGWQSPFGLMLQISKGGQQVDFIDSFGRRIAFPRVAPGRSFYSRYEHITLERNIQGIYSIVSGDGSRLEFAHHTRKQHCCTAVLDANGQGHRLEYHPGNTLPAYILCSGGQVLGLSFVHAGRHNGQAAPRLQSVNLLQGLMHPPSTQSTHQTYTQQESVFYRLNLLHEHCKRMVLDIEREQWRQPLVRYAYNDQGDLISVHSHNLAQGNGATQEQLRRQFAWQNHLMVMHTLGPDLQAHYAYDRYDPQGRVTHHWQIIANGKRHQAQRHWYFEYAPSHTAVTEQVGEGADKKQSRHQRLTLYHFDSQGRWTGTTEPNGAHTRFELDNWGNVKAIHHPDGGSTRHILDGQGRPLQTTNAAGETTTVIWHSQFALPSEIINPLGASVKLAYDARGNLIAQTDPLGHTTHFDYNPQGLLTRITDAKGGVKHLRYDAWGQLRSHTDCSGQSTHFDYDPQGHLSQSTNALGQTTHYRHDPQGQLLEIKHPEGSTERFEYDTQGRLTAHTDVGGHTTRWRLAGDGLPIERSNALGHTLRYEYDEWRRLSALLNENQRRYRFIYDEADRLLGQWGFDGVLSEFAYSLGGQLRQVREYGQIAPDPNAAYKPDLSERDRAQHLIETRFERDLVGRLLGKHVKARGQAVQRTRFVYDAAGQLTRAANAHSVVQLRYDAAGQLVEEQLQAPGLAPPALWPKGNEHPGGRIHVLRHQYDALGNRVATTLPDGRVLNTLHYGSGHVHQINIDGECISDFERDALHRETQRSQGALQSHTAYDVLGRVTGQRVGWGALNEGQLGQPSVGGTQRRLGQGVQIRRGYSYDRAGQLAKISDWEAGTLSYRYDPLGQLLQANEERFAFDPAHNLLSAEAGTTGSAPATLPDNRLQVFEDKRYSHDPHGRVCHKRSGSPQNPTETELHWDAEHQLIRSVTRRSRYNSHSGHSDSTPSTELHYAYDPFGRRIAKYRRDKDGKVQAKDSHWYVWDGNRLLQEISPQPGHPKLPLRARIDTYVYEPDSFVPLAQLQSWDTLGPPKAADGQKKKAAHDNSKPQAPPLPPPDIRYYHCDQIGTPRELTRANGQITWQATYKAWGNTQTVQWEVQDAQALEPNGYGYSQGFVEQDKTDRSAQQPLRFQGQYYDEETGLHYNRFRYYDPDCGRFVSHDPIGLSGGENTYSSVPNTTFWFDASGLNSAKLNSALGGITGDKRQAHHLIPEEIWTKKQAFLDRLGLGRDSKENGILVPDSASSASNQGKRVYHCGSHADYSAMVEGKLTSIEDRFNQGQITMDRAQLEVRSLQRGLYRKINTGKISTKSACGRLH